MELIFVLKNKLVILLLGMMMVGIIASTTTAQTVTIATGNFAEPQILAEAVKILIEEETDLEVNHLRNFTAVSLMNSALVSGDIEMYIAWTGTVFATVLGNEVTDEWKDPKKVEAFVQEQFDEQYDAHWFDSFGFNNTYVVAVREDWAAEHGVTTISELRDKGLAEEMVLGMDVVFREQVGDGYEAFTSAYDIEFQRARSMDYGLLYRAAGSGDIDAAVAYSTDGRIVSNNLVGLEDDLNFFPPYDGALVASNSFLEAYPEVKDIVAPLIGQIDTATMAYYNQLVDVDFQEVADVAEMLLDDIVRNQ